MYSLLKICSTAPSLREREKEGEAFPKVLNKEGEGG